MPTDTPEARTARLNAYEARYIPKIAAALIKSVEPAISAYEQGATPALAAAYVKDTHVAAVLEQLYRVVAVAEATRTYEQLTEGQKAAPPTAAREGWLSRARRFIQGEGRTALLGLTERTRTIVQAVLVEVQELGLSIPDGAKRLREQVAGLSRSRAVAITRTETTAASNVGSLWGAQATGLRLNKAWLATLSSRTRDSHLVANGQAVGLEAFFVVGKGKGRYPGDPLLPIEERANCRCAIGYSPIE